MFCVYLVDSVRSVDFDGVTTPWHRAASGAMNDLAFTFCKIGRFCEAEELEREVFQTRKGMLGHNHPDTLIATILAHQS